MGNGTDHIDVPIVEACIVCIKDSKRCFTVAMRLRGMGWDVAPRPLLSIVLKAIPSETFLDKTNGVSGIEELIFGK